QNFHFHVLIVMDLDGLVDDERSDDSFEYEEDPQTPSFVFDEQKVYDLFQSLSPLYLTVTAHGRHGDTYWVNVADAFGLHTVKLLIKENERYKACDHAALQEYLSQFIRVPKVLAFDSGTSNPLRSQYIVQTVKRGSPLSSALGSFTWMDRWHFIPQLADVLLKTEKIGFEESGRVVAADIVPFRSVLHNQPSIFATVAGSLNDLVEVGPFLKGSGGDVRDTLTYSSLYQGLIKCQLESWYASERLSESPEGSPDSSDYETRPPEKVLYKIAKRMSVLGFFDKEQPHVLWLREPVIHNLFVSKINNKWRITGLGELDVALSVPRVLTREPPKWLWTFNNSDGGEDPNRSLSRPEQALKDAFDLYMERAAPGWKEDAYDTGEWIRRFAKFALDHFPSHNWDSYHQFVHDWDEYLELRGKGPSCRAKGTYTNGHATSEDENGDSLDKKVEEAGSSTAEDEALSEESEV
ncbi:MAG: hypothetical protein Q9181_007929, partial [Wetmoreana brouardii]